MRIKQPEFHEALQVYYSHLELSTGDIACLFDVSRTTALKLKRMAEQQMTEDEMIPWNSGCVLTKSAYKAWNLDIDEIEKRCRKLDKMNEKEGKSA